MSDNRIIENCQKGNPDEFGALYDKYIRKIYDFIYYKTQHKETAEDLTSVTFTKVLEKIHGFDCAKGTFQAWLYQIARNTVIDHYRTKKHETDIEDIWDLSGNDDPERDLDTKKKLEQVDDYLNKLKPDQREIIILRVWQGLSYKEIAEITGRSEDAAKMKFSRVVRKLRADMPLAVFVSFLLTRI